MRSPRQELALSVSALFLGVELMADLDPERVDTNRIFGAITAVAQVGEALMHDPDVQKGLGAR